MQKEYTDDGLSVYMYTVSSLKAVRHRYTCILFVYGELGFFGPAVRAYNYILGLTSSHCSLQRNLILLGTNRLSTGLANFHAHFELT